MGFKPNFKKCSEGVFDYNFTQTAGAKCQFARRNSTMHQVKLYFRNSFKRRFTSIYGTGVWSGSLSLRKTPTLGTDYTLSLVLRGFGQCTVLTGHATSSVSCHHVALFACALFCYYDNLAVIWHHVRHLRFPGQHCSFQGFFYKCLENFYNKFQDFPYFSRSARTLQL